jgi:hypothetical protein
MNCRRFRHQLFDYQEGSLPQRAQAAAERHLAKCVICRQMASRQRRVEQALADQFRRETDSLQLPPVVGHRVLAALTEKGGGLEQQGGKIVFWPGLAWRLAVAAGILLLAGVLFFPQAPRPEAPRPPPGTAAEGVSIHLSYVVPTYTFRREGGFVIDALTYQTNVVNERLGREFARAQ